jgi:hypothetical protein
VVNSSKETIMPWIDVSPFGVAGAVREAGEVDQGRNEATAVSLDVGPCSLENLELGGHAPRRSLVASNVAMMSPGERSAEPDHARRSVTRC